MPRSISLFSITLRRTTTIFMVNGNLRHIDGSTTITNRNTFNIENTISEPLAQSSPAVSLIVGNDGKVVFWVLKASWALIYNDLIQLQPPWYLQILQPRLKHMIRVGLQVRDKFRYTFGIGAHNLYVYARYVSNPPRTRVSRPVEMVASVPSTVSKFKHSGTCFHADIHTFERRLHKLVSMNEDPIALEHRSRRIRSHLFSKKLKDGLKENCNAT